MCCYGVPAVAALVHYAIRKRRPAWGSQKHQQWLTLMLSGGAIFGIVDHLYHGELFLVGDDFAKDLLLGVLITTVILASWVIVVYKDKADISHPRKAV